MHYFISIIGFVQYTDDDNRQTRLPLGRREQSPGGSSAHYGAWHPRTEERREAHRATLDGAASPAAGAAGRVTRQPQDLGPHPEVLGHSLGQTGWVWGRAGEGQRHSFTEPQGEGGPGPERSERRPCRRQTVTVHKAHACPLTVGPKRGTCFRGDVWRAGHKAAESRLLRTLCGALLGCRLLWALLRGCLLGAFDRALLRRWRLLCRAVTGTLLSAREPTDRE